MSAIIAGAAARQTGPWGPNPTQTYFSPSLDATTGSNVKVHGGRAVTLMGNSLLSFESYNRNYQTFGPGHMHTSALRPHVRF